MNVFPLADLTARLDIASDATTRKALTLGLAVGFLGPRWGSAQLGQRLQPTFAALESGRHAVYVDAMAPTIRRTRSPSVMPVTDTRAMPCSSMRRRPGASPSANGVAPGCACRWRT